MTDPTHLVQDLRAEAHRVPDDIGQLMRDAASALERVARVLVEIDRDGVPDVRAVPFPPPADDRAPCD